MIALLSLLSTLHGAESLPSCRLDSLPLEPGRATLECVVEGTSDTLWVWPDAPDYSAWGYDLVGAEWAVQGELVWGIAGDAILCPRMRMTSAEWHAETD